MPWKHVFDFTDGPPALALARWCDHLARVGYAVTAEPLEPNFKATVEASPIGSLSLSRVMGTPVLVQRTARDLASGFDGIAVVLHLDGHQTLTHHAGHENRMRPGDLLVIDGDQPLRDLHPEGYEQLFLRIPKSLLRERCIPLPACIGQKLPRESLSNQMATGALSALARSIGASEGPTLPREEDEEAIVANILSLVENLGLARPAEGRAFVGQMERVERILERRFADPALSSAQVASEMKVSLRYLQLLLQRRGETFASLLRRYRVQRAKELLARSQMSVGEIAAAVGYHDLSTFSRAFRRVTSNPAVVFRRMAAAPPGE